MLCHQSNIQIKVFRTEVAALQNLAVEHSIMPILLTTVVIHNGDINNFYTSDYN